MYCLYCGKKLGKNANFCGKCGKPVGSPDNVGDETMPIRPDEAAPGNGKNSGKGSRLLIAAIVASGVLLIGCIVLLIVLLHASGAKNDLDNGRQLLAAGIAQYQDGDYAAAEESFTEAAEVFASSGNTDSVEFSTAVIGAADSLAERGDYTGAIEVIDRYRDQLPPEESADAEESYQNGTSTNTIEQQDSGIGTTGTTSATGSKTGENDNTGKNSNGSEQSAGDGEFDLNQDGNGYSFYQDILDAYSDAMAQNSWSGVTESDKEISYQIAYSKANGDTGAIYYALVDVSGTGTAELLIGSPNSGVEDAFTPAGRIFDNVGGLQSNFISVMDTGTIYSVIVPPAGGFRMGTLCGIEADGQTVKTLDTWETTGMMSETYYHNDVEYTYSTYEEIDDIIDTYGDEVDIEWTPLTQGCQVSDALVQAVQITHSFGGGTSAADTGTTTGGTDYGSAVDVAPTSDQMVSSYWVRCDYDLRIRSGPGLDYTMITMLEEDIHSEMLVMATCEVYEPSLNYGNTWGFVQYFDNGGGYGWCYLGFTSRIASSDNESQVNENQNDLDDLIADGINDDSTNGEVSGCYVLTEIAHDYGSSESTISFEYDSQGHILSQSLNGGEMYSFNCDENGRITYETCNGHTYSCFYDDDGRLTEIFYASDTINPSFTYDSDGRIISYLSDARLDYEYDDDDRLVQCEAYQDGLIETYEYEYDENGNLSRALCYYNPDFMPTADPSVPDSIITYTWAYLPNADTDIENYMTLYLTF